MSLTKYANCVFGQKRVRVTSLILVFCLILSVLLASCHFKSLYFVDFSVPFRHGERIGFSYLISQKYTGDNAAVRVLRNSVILNFDIKLVTHKRLIPAHNRGRPPSYYIIAGFVFTTVSVPYLRSEVCNSLLISLRFLSAIGHLVLSV